MDSLSNVQLLQLIQEDDSAAYKELFDRFWEKLYRFAWKRLKSRQDAEDVVQQVFLKLWEHRATRNIQSVDQYLYKSVYYEVLSGLQKMMSDPEDITTLNESILPSFNDIQQRIGTSELDKALEAAINKLPPRMQEVYRLSREAELSTSEIAEKLNLSEQTVKNHLTLALSRLRKPLTEAMVIIVLVDLTLS